MKILHLCISAFYIDNYSYQENMLTKYHVKMGHDVTVIASNYSFDKNGKSYYMSGSKEYVNNDGVKVIRLEYKKPFYRINRLLRRFHGLYPAIEKTAPDLIFTHNISAIDMHQITLYLKQHPQVRLYADNHADYINSGKNFLSRKILHGFIWKHYAKEIEPYITTCFGVTPMRCRFLKEVYHINPDKVEFLPMGIDDEAIPQDRIATRKSIRQQLGITDTDFIILTGGKIDRLKNTHVLVEAVKRIANPKVHLVICGTLTTEMQYLQEEFRTSENIHYLGWCNSEQVINHMVASDLACFPGTHSTLWEQSVGIALPAIFKRWPEMEHVNINGNCLFVKGDDVDELQQAILQLLNAPYYNQLKQLATEASSHFLYSSIAQKAIGQSPNNIKHE